MVDKTAAKLNELLKSIGALDDDTTFIVRGTVKTDDGKPISGASVIVFDRDLRKLQPFGETTTNDLGDDISVSSREQFSRGVVPGAKMPKLVARALVGDQQIGDDVSRPNPSRDEVVDFRMPAAVVSEWDSLTTGVAPLLEGQGKDDQPLPPWR